MTDIEKALEMVVDAAKMRGMYDQSQIQIKSLESELSQAKEWITAWQGAHGLDRERNSWKLKAERLADALSMTLPMAKGYAHEHRVGANQSKCDIADELLAAFQAGK